VVAAYGDHVVRLIAFVPGMITRALSPLWVELQDACVHVDGAGCKELSEAIAAAESFWPRQKS